MNTTIDDLATFGLEDRSGHLDPVAQARERLDVHIRAARRAPRTWTRHRRRRAVALLAAVMIAAVGTGFAVPATRDLLVDSWRGWLGGGDATPGTALSLSALDPAAIGLTPTAGFELATVPGFPSLIGYRNEVDGNVCVSFGDTGCYLPADVLAAFDVAPIWLFELAPGRGMDGVLAGLSSDEVRSVRLDYVDGPSARAASPRNGFILELDFSRRPKRIVALAQNGTELAALSAPFDVRGLVAFPDGLDTAAQTAWWQFPPVP